ncbi:hypothetical protein AMECASPLE_021487 [Ameca splendens]|uniref:CBM20 domain-containing protein n=1 Tax=Ameca splendens TaxID=208324 RepID=A0ABV0ZZ73_9TELE
MQLKNNNMEKRTDLASLFCTIGRHGPAVAVAVIAMVSVVAGFIIYRTVKGKRRKAEAGAGHGGSSPGTLRDASLPQPEKELSPEYEALSREESTDMSEAVSNARNADATWSLSKLRNRRTVSGKTSQSSSPSKREVGPEELCSASHMDKISSIPLTNAEEAIKSLQDDMCELKDLNVECKGYKCDLVTPKDSEEDHSISVEPLVVRESLGKEKVQCLQEGEVATEDVSNEMPCREEAYLCDLHGPVCREGKTPISLNENDKKNCQAVSASDTEGYFEEPTIHMHESPLCTKNEDKISVLDDSSFNKPHPANEDFNVTLHKQVDNQLITVTSVTMPAIHGADAERSPNGDVTENKLTNLGDLSVNHAVLPSSKESELKQDSSTCSKENIENVKQSSFGEPQETSALVLSPVLPCLSVEPETIQDDQTLPLVSLQPEYIMNDEVTTELAKETSGALFELGCACPQSEIDETINILIPKENVEILLSSADGEPNAVVSDEFSPAASVSTEMSCPDESSFQNQESEQVQNMKDLLEVPAAPAPVMADSIEPQIGKDQLLSENQSKLTSCSSDLEESRISGMKVGPDLCDAGECPLTPENMRLAAVDDHLQSQDQVELQTTMADLQSVIKEEPVDAVTHSLNDSQPLIEETDKANDDSCTVNEMCHETESFNRAVGQLSNDAPTVCLSEDLGMMDTKIVIEGKEEDKTTEINIMEATMDNNEWITDGTAQVPPWMKTSVPLINPVSLEENIQTSVPVDAACTNADVPTANESEEANTVPPIDEPTETGKRVLAVQPMPQSVSVTFRIHYLTHSPYQKVAITGNHWELGNWKDFVPLEKAKDGLWATVVSLPAESYVEWKFVVVDRGQVCRWEECDNRFLDTGNSENLLVHKCWGFL